MFLQKHFKVLSWNRMLPQISSQGYCRFHKRKLEWFYNVSSGWYHESYKDDGKVKIIGYRNWNICNLFIIGSRNLCFNLFNPIKKYMTNHKYLDGCQCFISICNTGGTHYDLISSKGNTCNCGHIPPVLKDIVASISLVDEYDESDNETSEFKEKTDGNTLEKWVLFSLQSLKILLNTV